MSINKINYQFPEKTISNDIHNQTIPVKGDVVIKDGKKYLVAYRIFNEKERTISLIMEEV